MRATAEATRQVGSIWGAVRICRLRCLLRRFQSSAARGDRYDRCAFARASCRKRLSCSTSSRVALSPTAVPTFSKLEESNIVCVPVRGGGAGEADPTSMAAGGNGGRSCVITNRNASRACEKSPRRSRSRTRCCSKDRFRRASRCLYDGDVTVLVSVG